MSPKIMIGLIFVSVGIVVLVIGYLIRVKKQLSLIAGFNLDQVKDKDGLSQWLGTGLLALGGIDALFGVVTVVLLNSGRTALIIFVVLTVVIAGVVIAGARKYFK